MTSRSSVSLGCSLRDLMSSGAGWKAGSGVGEKRGLHVHLPIPSAESPPLALRLSVSPSPIPLPILTTNFPFHSLVLQPPSSPSSAPLITAHSVAVHLSAVGPTSAIYSRLLVCSYSPTHSIELLSFSHHPPFFPSTLSTYFASLISWTAQSGWSSSLYLPTPALPASTNQWQSRLPSLRQHHRFPPLQ